MSTAQPDVLLSAQGRRQALIDRFNDEPSTFAFLISTTAGGVGINLTSANKFALRLLSACTETVGEPAQRGQQFTNCCYLSAADGLA